MEKTSNTPKANNNYYNLKKPTIKSPTPIDSLEFKRILDEETAKIEVISNSKLDNFKTLVNSAEAKLANQVTISPLKDEADNAEVHKIIPYVPIKFIHNLKYIGYKGNYGYKRRLYTDYNDIEVQNNLSTSKSLEKVSEKKSSFWQKFKNAIKTFFNGEKQSSSSDLTKSKIDTNFKENIKVSQNSYSSCPDPNAPQIDKYEMEKRRIRNYRAAALANEHPPKIKEDEYSK